MMYGYMPSSFLGTVVLPIFPPFFHFVTECTMVFAGLWSYMPCPLKHCALCKSLILKSEESVTCDVFYMFRQSLGG